MILEKVIHSVERRLYLMGQVLLHGGPVSEVAEECDQLQEEMATLAAEHSAQVAQLEALRQRIAERTAEVALLPSQVEDSMRRGKAERAMRQALELDKLRTDLAADRALLPRAEHLCWSLDFRLRHLQRELARTRQELQRRT